MPAFEVSAMNLSALTRALEARGLLDRVKAAVKPETRAALDDPMSARWHPGAVAVDTWQAIVDAEGPAQLEALNLKVTAESFGPVVRPLVKVALALGGSSPATVFARLNDAIKVATRGVTVTWTPSGAQAGQVAFEYPCAMPPVVVEHGWRGVMRFGEELTGKTLRFERFEVASDRRFVFHVAW
ncbi:MAG: hypothetical protein AB1730_19165 [Myxococcota bacterium]|jgi:hypothetical protein